MNGFNYRREIPDEQPSWLHTPRIVRSLRQASYVRPIACMFGVRPHRTEHIVKVHKAKTHNLFIVRKTGLTQFPDVPNHRDGDFD